jgi:maleamate amidohydrolase
MIDYSQYLTERDREVLSRAGFGGRVGFGQRPVIVVIDVSYSFCGVSREPILKSIETYHNSCGEEAWDGVAAIARLIEAGRAKRIPVIYTTGYSEPIAGTFGLGRWTDKVPAEAEDIDAQANEIVAEIAPREHDIVIEKTMPSAFFGTNLASYLVNLMSDTIVVCGTTTSGCVRATVVDGFSHNYRVNVVEEGTFDRSQASHAINLFDMDMKYADVVELEDAIDYIGALPPGLYDEQMPILSPSASWDRTPPCPPAARNTEPAL